MKQAAAIIKNGWRLSNSCLRTTFRGSRFNSIGQLLTLRSASPTTSPNKCSDRKFGHRRWLSCGHIAKRIKKLDRQLQFFVKKLAHVRHSRAATAQKHALRRISLLLPTIMADGTH